jgi:type IV pilus assembly protein PilA
MAASKASGFTLVELMIVIAIISVLVSIAVPNLLDARIRANETAAIGGLRALITAQTLFREADRDMDGVFDYATSLTELGPSVGRYVDEVLASGTKQGYFFQVLPGADGFTWCATAEPQVPGKSGSRHFFVDESGTIRYSTTSSAGVGNRPVGD